MFNGGGMIMLEKVASLMEEEWSCYGGGQFHGLRMVDVTEVVTLMDICILYSVVSGVLFLVYSTSYL